MNKNQNINCIFICSIIIFFLCWPYHSHSQQNEAENKLFGSDISANELLFVADSLFQNKKYTESYSLYKSIFDQDQSSPSMLLKMAFIQEGLGDFGSALYYLNLYYLQTSNKQVLTKMEALAAKHQLKGYDYSDAEYFLTYYNKYQAQITIVLISMIIMLFSMIFYLKRKRNKPPVIAGIFFVILLGILYLQVNYGDVYRNGIILYADSYLMQAPSSGADLLEVVQQGHRVKILGKEDVWVKISWNGNPAYIRENNIRKISL